MPEIRPITDLRNTNEISALCHARQEPVFITKNGYGDLVVMSVEAYTQLTQNAAIDAAIGESEESLRRGDPLYDAREVLEELEAKYFGDV